MPEKEKRKLGDEPNYISRREMLSRMIKLAAGAGAGLLTGEVLFFHKQSPQTISEKMAGIDGKGSMPPNEVSIDSGTGGDITITTGENPGK